jgi:hypothetical protein
LSSVIDECHLQIGGQCGDAFKAYYQCVQGVEACFEPYPAPAGRGFDLSRIRVYSPERPAPRDDFAPFLQPKLKVGSVDDPLEREADEVAHAMLREPARPALERNRVAPAEPIAPLRADAAPSVDVLQRKYAECEEEEKIQRKVAGASGGDVVAPPVVHDVLRSPGKPRGHGARCDLRTDRSAGAAATARDGRVDRATSRARISLRAIEGALSWSRRHARRRLTVGRDEAEALGVGVFGPIGAEARVGRRLRHDDAATRRVKADLGWLTGRVAAGKGGGVERDISEGGVGGRCSVVIRARIGNVHRAAAASDRHSQQHHPKLTHHGGAACHQGAPQATTFL